MKELATPPSILLLSKDTLWCHAAERFVRALVPEVVVCAGGRSDPLPGETVEWTGDYIISFLSPWIVPPDVLARARVAALNFHPAPPEYPGIGCYNFALYDGVDGYGVTCHHMAARVDSGPLVRVARFPVFPGDTVELLKERSMVFLLQLFYEVIATIVAGQPLPVSAESWTRRPYTRRELDALCRITPDMPRGEIDRRIRATTFPSAPGPYLEIGDRRFEPIVPKVRES